MRPFVSLLRRDLRLAWRDLGDSLLALVFFVLALTLFPLGIGPGPNTLRIIGVGVIWVLALLSVLLTLDRLFKDDAADGSLEQMALSTAPFEVLLVAKGLAHWLTAGLPLALIAPLLGLMFGLPAEVSWRLSLALLLGTPALTLIGMVGAALLLTAKRGGVLIALLVLPLDVPVLIFGVSAVESVTASGARASLLLLGAIDLLGIALAPFAAAAALRLQLE